MPTDLVAPRYLAKHEVAARIGVEPEVVDEWSRRGAMPFAIRLGAGVLRWSVDELDEWERTTFAKRLRASDTEARSAEDV